MTVKEFERAVLRKLRALKGKVSATLGGVAKVSHFPKLDKAQVGRIANWQSPSDQICILFSSLLKPTVLATTQCFPPHSETIGYLACRYGQCGLSKGGYGKNRLSYVKVCKLKLCFQTSQPYYMSVSIQNYEILWKPLLLTSQ